MKHIVISLLAFAVVLLGLEVKYLKLRITTLESTTHDVAPARPATGHTRT